MKGKNEPGSAQVTESNSNNMGQFTFLMVFSRICVVFLVLICTTQIAYSQQSANSENVDNGSSVDSLIRRPYGSLPIRIGFSYGWSQRISPSTSEGNSQQRKFDEELQTGQVLRLTFHYFPNETFGIGFKFNRFSTSHSDDITLIDNSSGMEFTDRVSEEIRATFVGISGLHREFIGSKFQLSFGLSIGVFFLRRDFEGFENEINFNDYSFGGEGEVNLDYYLVENLALGLGVAANIAPFQEMTDRGITVESLDFNRLDIFGGLRFYF